MRRPPVFTIGDRVRLNAAACQRLRLQREARIPTGQQPQAPELWRATVTGFGRVRGTIVVQRDGLKSKETWAANLWERVEG